MMKMTVSICPFCGIATAAPHETQELCIEALHLEIERTREILGRRQQHTFDARESQPELVPQEARKGATQPV